MSQRFEATFDSLRTYQCPEWFRDVKFGIWSHWGPQSVPMFGDWYARNMYIQGSPQNLYHVRHYGHPSKFGYKDICALWKAENFDPDELMDLYYRPAPATLWPRPCITTTSSTTILKSTPSTP